MIPASMVALAGDAPAGIVCPAQAAPRHPGGRIAQHRGSRNADVPACCEEELGLLVALG